MLNRDRPQIAMSPSPSSSAELPSFVSLLDADINPNAGNASAGPAQSISNIIEDFVMDDIDNGYGYNPLSPLNDEYDSDVSDDLPAAWDDECFLTELGFGSPLNRDEEDDNTLTNVMQRLGAYSMLFKSNLACSLSFFFYSEPNS